MSCKRPVSVLVVVHTPALDILLLERAAHPGFWQSITGSLEAEETPSQAAVREIAEETGIVCAKADLADWHLSNRFELLPQWRNRYAQDVHDNLEHVFSLCIPRQDIVIAPGEHTAWRWLPWHMAASACFSWSNRDAILMLGQAAGQPMRA